MKIYKKVEFEINELFSTPDLTRYNITLGYEEIGSFNLNHKDNKVEYPLYAELAEAIGLAGTGYYDYLVFFNIPLLRKSKEV